MTSEQFFVIFEMLAFTILFSDLADNIINYLNKIFPPK
jgi:hypothetical protein